MIELCHDCTMSAKRQAPDKQQAHDSPYRRGIAFLVAQLGAHAAHRFCERMAEIGLTPPLAGIMRAVADDPGCSQQRLATRLGVPPSKMVSLVDELETRGLVERKRRPADRRQYAVHLTAAGTSTMRRIGHLARANDQDLCQSLDVAEREILRDLLDRIAQQQGLTPGVHPGYTAMN